MHLSWSCGFEFCDPHLDRYVGRNELHITHALQAHVVDGRRLQVVQGVRLRKTEAFSQIMLYGPTWGCVLKLVRNCATATSGAGVVLLIEVRAPRVGSGVPRVRFYLLCTEDRTAER